MTGKEMIKVILDNNLEDFELKISNMITTQNGWGIDYIVKFIDTTVDIGYSDKTVTFDTKE